MITAIEGTLADSGVEWVDVSVGGITVRANVPQSAVEALGNAGDRVKLFTSLQVRDDSLTLYGFPSQDGRAAFETLIAVNGVGPRVALSVLSALTPESLALAVASGDSDTFKRVPGVGTRTANRIILELKGKLDLDLAATAADREGDAEVVGALTALGYTASEAMVALSSLPPDDSSPVEERVRLCLQRLGSR